LGEKCPVCGRKARVVWRSSDGGTIAVKCGQPHEFGGARNYPGNSLKRVERGLVFLIDIKDEAFT
jgi:hypothetical protein